mgnify:FL=1
MDKNVTTRYYSDVPDQQRNTYLNVDNFENSTFFYASGESSKRVSNQTDPNLGNQSMDGNLKQNCSDTNSELLIPALRPPPPNLKKLESSVLMSNAETSLRQGTIERENRNHSYPAVNEKDLNFPQTSACTSSWFGSSQSNIKTQESLSQESFFSNQTNVSGTSNNSNQDFSGRVLRTKVIDINTKSDLFHDETDSISNQISKMWLDKNQIASEPSFPNNVDMYSSILKDKSQGAASLSYSSDGESKKINKKKSVPVCNNSLDGRSCSIRGNIDNHCPTISQAFFKNINSAKDVVNCYEGCSEEKNKSLSTEYSLNVASNNSPSHYDRRITSIKQTHSPLVGLSGELREKKLEKLWNEMPDTSDEERLTALQRTGWDVPAAIKFIKLDRLLRWKNNFIYELS